MNHLPVCTILGAGPGMGLALAKTFGQLGYQLVLVARKKENLAGLESELLKDGFTVTLMSADLGDPVQIKALFNVIHAEQGPTEVLIYNASAYRPVIASAVEVSDLLADMAISVGGVIEATRAVLEPMVKAAKGTILVTGGGSGIEPMMQAATLSIGKAALRNLCMQLYTELAPKGIHFSTVTICGWIQPETHFAPTKIADVYRQIHLQPRSQWTWEHIYE